MSWNESLHPRDPAGRSTGGRFVSLRSKIETNSAAMSEGDLRDRVLEPDGGFTYETSTGKEPRWGFSVSTRPDLSEPFEPKTFSYKQIKDYYVRNLAVLSEKGNYIGAWHNPKTGQGFLDVSRVVGSASEAEKLSKRHDQISYFVLHEGHSVTVNEKAKSGGIAQ